MDTRQLAASCYWLPRAVAPLERRGAQAQGLWRDPAGEVEDLDAVRLEAQEHPGPRSLRAR